MEFDAMIRDLKIGYITDKIDLSIKSEITNRFQNELDFIVKNFPDSIITGSLALNLFGFLDRKIWDIDLIVNKEINREDLVLESQYSITDVNYLGFSYLYWKPNFFSRKKKYKVDFILNDNAIYYDLFYKDSVLKVQNPISIIEKKYELIKKNSRIGIYSKNMSDLSDIFNEYNV